MSDPARRPDAIFDQVVELPPADRTARLTELCSKDTALRTEVESLLAASDACGDFLERPAELAAAGDTVERSDLAGTTIGPWLLREHLGSGGMGDVWLATRTLAGTEQTVAVKIVRAAILTPDAMRRFRNECRMLARLDHPGIARLIEGGVTDAGLPYLVVEHVAGRPIDAWCDERKLDLRGRVALLAQVCEAVRHLHRHSVLHRDLKPGNVLVDDEGRPRLIDFGIARALDAADDDELTVVGLERMTPAYASPEQLRGDDLSLASDVYSLGVLAYRLLTGALPYAGRRRQDLEREITTTGPRRPSDTAGGPLPAHLLKGDLDTILLAALRAEPARRYPSAEALREDLARFLDGRPVLARGESFGYVAGKFAKRHAAAVALGAVAVVTLLAATITGFTLYRRAETARVEAESQKVVAEEVSRFLQGLLAAVDPLSSDAHTDITVREALDAASRRLERELTEQPATAAALHLTIGNAYANLGLFDEGGRHLAAAAKLYGPDQLDDAAGAAGATVRQADLALKQGHYAAAESLLAPTLDVSDPDLQALAQLSLARLRTDQSRLDEAAAAARIALAAAGRAHHLEPVLPAQAAGQLGTILYRQGRYAAAETVLVQAAQLARDDMGDAHALTGECVQNVGVVLTALGRPEEAIEAFSEALRIYERVYPAGHVEFATTLTNLADAESGVGRHADALADYTRARAIVEANLGREHVNWGLVTNGMAYSHWRLGEPAAADTLYRQAIAVMAAGLGEHHPWPAVGRCNLARVCLELGRSDEAAALAERSRADLEAAFPGGHVYTARTLTVLAEIDLERGMAESAAARISRADTLTGSQPASGSDRVAVGLLRARYLRLQGQPALASHLLDSLQVLVAESSVPNTDLLARIERVR